MRQPALHCLGCCRRGLTLHTYLEYIISEQRNLGLLRFMRSRRYSLRTGQGFFLLPPHSPSHVVSSTLKRVSHKLNNQGEKPTHLEQGTLSSQLSLVVANIWVPLFIHSVSFPFSSTYLLPFVRLCLRSFQHALWNPSSMAKKHVLYS